MKRKSKAKNNKIRPRWTKEEVSLLKRLYRTHSNAEIAGILGRKVSSVVFKGHRLGLSKGALGADEEQICQKSPCRANPVETLK
jgi:hypothetical protein